MMTAARYMGVQAWMTARETVAVMAALNGGAEQAQALFVGGCVRNALMGRGVDDVDIATRLVPEEATRRLEQAGIRVVPTGLAHGTVTAVCGGKGFEITTLRRDVETDGRHATIAFTDDWREDAARRDFTMNTLLADGAGAVYDPQETGLADLEAGRVRFVGDPAARIAEDYLRILRFFRFHAIYGRGAADPSALAACGAAAEKIGGLSRERITHEVLKIIMADDPAAALGLMFGCGVLAGLAGAAYDPAVLTRLAQGRAGAAARLAVLDMPDAARERYLILPNRILKDMEILAAALSGLDAVDDSAAKLLIYRHGADHAAQILLSYAALHGGQADLFLVQNWTPPRFPLTGDDVMKAGVPAGPQVGAILKELERWWIGQDFQPGRVECLERLGEREG